MKKMMRSGACLFIFFAFIGTIFGLAGLAAYLNDNKLREQGISTQGVVVDMVYSRKGGAAPVIEFTTQNGEKQTYVHGVYSNPAAYEPGESVQLWYNPEQPSKVVLKGFTQWIIPLVFTFIFMIFGGIGYGGLLFRYIRNKQKEALKTNGTRIEADLTAVFHNTSYRVGSTSPFVIRCTWRDTQADKTYAFESEYVWVDPNPYVRNRTIPVMIDPSNPEKYWVDLSFLPENE